jgi:hypothetical protein
MKSLAGSSERTTTFFESNAVCMRWRRASWRGSVIRAIRLKSPSARAMSSAFAARRSASNQWLRDRACWALLMRLLTDVTLAEDMGVRR